MGPPPEDGPPVSVDTSQAGVAFDSLLGFREEGLFLRGLAQWMGFSSSRVEFEAGQRHEGATSYTLGRMIRLMWTGVSSFSIVPLTVQPGAELDILVEGAGLVSGSELLVDFTLSGDDIQCQRTFGTDKQAHLFWIPGTGAIAFHGHDGVHD